MTNRYITTKIKIKNIGDLTVNPNYNYSNNSNRSIIRVEFITNELDMYTMESIPKHINVNFNFNYAKYQEIFDQIFLPYLEISENGEYLIDQILNREFIGIFHLKFNEYYDTTYYLVKGLISIEDATQIINTNIEIQ